MTNYNVYPGGPDIISNTPMTVVDTIRNVSYQVMIVDFYIDEFNTGIVYFDGMEILQQTNIPDYDALSRLFYSQFSIQM